MKKLPKPPARVQCTYQMDVEALDLLDLERMRRLRRGEARSTATLSQLVNEAVVQTYQPNGGKA